MIQARGWVEAKDLRIGDEAILQDGRLTQIQSIEQAHVSSTKVYNLEVEDFHTYFVGEDGVWVHNYRENLQLDAYQNPSILSGIGQRLNNAWNDRGFYTDEQLIGAAAELDRAAGITNDYNRIAMTQELGYPLSPQDYQTLQNYRYPEVDPISGMRYRSTYDSMYETPTGAILPRLPRLTSTFRAPTTVNVGTNTHNGIDTDTNDCPQCNLSAAAEGRVIEVRTGRTGRDPAGGYGNFVRILHANGEISTYAHLTTVNVTPDTFIRRGQSLGTTGNIGNTRGATGNHLHYEVVDHTGQQVDPASYVIR